MAKKSQTEAAGGADAKYEELRDANRVVMRHNIALNIDSFKASSDEFEPRATRDFPKLREVTPPFASVIVPNYNGRRFLQPLFAALEQQTFQDFEVVFVDDASTDQSIQYLEEAFGHHLEDQPGARPVGFDLRLVVSRSNKGFVRSCNGGAAIARGRVLVLLNNDTEPDKDWLAELLGAFCTDPRIATVASKIMLHDERDRLHTAGDMLRLDGIPFNRGAREKDEGQYDAQTRVFSGCGGGSAYRRDVWHLLGGFDEDFWMYMEDVDLGFRMQLAGWQASFAPSARIYHHVNGTGGGVLASYYVGRNTIWMIVKNMPRGLLLRHFPQIVGAQLSISLDALRNIRGQAARARLKGQLSGLLGVLKQLRKRRIIQQRRILDDAELERRLV